MPAHVHAIRRHRVFLAIGPVVTVVLAIVLAACAAGTGPSAGAAARAAYQLPAGTSSHQVSVGGIVRTYLTYRPAGLAAGAPLVVMMHPDGSSDLLAERDYHWNAEADRGHFIVSYPQGLHASWNTGGGCCSSRANDIGFISDMVQAIGRHNPIDDHRIYATGMSSGGMLAYALACQTTIFAAIAPDSATQLSPCPRPAPLSVLHIHGTADQVISYYPRAGGALAGIGGPDIPSVNAFWRRIDHCAAPAITTSGIVTTSIAACPSGRTVELVTVAGMGHQWPGAASGSGSPPAAALDATQVIWEFFTNHHR